MRYVPDPELAELLADAELVDGLAEAAALEEREELDEPQAAARMAAEATIATRAARRRTGGRGLAWPPGVCNDDSMLFPHSPSNWSLRRRIPMALQADNC